MLFVPPLDTAADRGTVRLWLPAVAGAGLIDANSRVVLEKPLGRDLASAKQINREVGEVFEESQIYRIDHYLGKETVQNLLAFRFSNGIYEPLWNKSQIDHIQIR